MRVSTGLDKVEEGKSKVGVTVFLLDSMKDDGMEDEGFGSLSTSEFGGINEAGGNEVKGERRKVFMDEDEGIESYWFFLEEGWI